MRELELVGGGAALVDDEDYERLARYRWRLDSQGYPIRTDTGVRAGRKRVVHYLHHQVLPKSDDRSIYVDHADGNPLNAQRANLRYATNSQNQANRRKVLTQTGAKGVTLHRGTGKYQAQVKRDGQNHYLGLHADPMAAALAYWEKARELFGDFAYTNVPEDELEAAAARRDDVLPAAA